MGYTNIILGVGVNALEQAIFNRESYSRQLPPGFIQRNDIHLGNISLKFTARSPTL